MLQRSGTVCSIFGRGDKPIFLLVPKNDAIVVGQFFLRPQVYKANLGKFGRAKKKTPLLFGRQVSQTFGLSPLSRLQAAAENGEQKKYCRPHLFSPRDNKAWRIAVQGRSFRFSAEKGWIVKCVSILVWMNLQDEIDEWVQNLWNFFKQKYLSRYILYPFLYLHVRPAPFPFLSSCSSKCIRAGRLYYWPLIDPSVCRARIQRVTESGTKRTKSVTDFAIFHRRTLFGKPFEAAAPNT